MTGSVDDFSTLLARIVHGHWVGRPREMAEANTLWQQVNILTEREIEVLKLVSQGLTNAQIAERLVVSPLTINAHLRSIFNKLDVTTRTAAARQAIDRGLV